MKAEKGNNNPPHIPLFRTGEQIEICVSGRLAQRFSYVVPAGLVCAEGQVVTVPLGSREVMGIAWQRSETLIPVAKIKPISRVIDALPPYTPTFRRWLAWVADYTLSPLGMVVKMALPPTLSFEGEQEVWLAVTDAIPTNLSPARQRVIEALRQGALPRRQLLTQPQIRPALLRQMIQDGQLREEYRSAESAPLLPLLDKPATLRGEQAQALDVIGKQQSHGFSPILLDGVTGSGKTEVYFEAIARLLHDEPEAQILVLLPEIALTTQWLQRCAKRFGAVAVSWHSGLTPAQRQRHWRNIALGRARLIVGARSALFLPYANLRLLVVDEEHEPAYKQEEGVLYHARDMAVARAKMEQIPVLLCSATPSLESYLNARSGKYHHLRLTERHHQQAEPVPQLIDIRRDKPASGQFLSPPLLRAMQRQFEAGYQSLLFLNRRGYAPLLLCRACGYRFACPNCTAWMVQHQQPARLHCHHCDTRLPMPRECPQCKADDALVACGPGVERIHEEVVHHFPTARIALLSSDGKALTNQIEAILAREIDIIIGTQMVAKGHHFSHLALVGVVDADLGLNGGDLRACEHSFQLLHQLAGRAGRDAVAGEAYLQTVQPEHPVMQALASHERDAFYEAECQQREAGGWPPYGRLASIVIDGYDERQVQQFAQMLARKAPHFEQVQIIGPAPAPLSRHRNRFRYRLLVKTARQIDVQSVMRQWLGSVKPSGNLRLRVDMDPQQFL